MAQAMAEAMVQAMAEAQAPSPRARGSAGLDPAALNDRH